jgi:putative aldouronate transport system permease protein
MEFGRPARECAVPLAAADNKKAVFLKRLNRSKYLLILFLPCLVYYVLFKYLPMFGLVISFKDYNLFRGVWASNWVGLKYYKMFFEGPDFLKLFRNTFLLGVYNVLFGLQPVNFLVQPEWFRPIYVLSDIWQHAGWGSIIYLAALTAIDPQLYEAAEIDGASRWKQLWNVTIPGIMPAMVIMLILNIGHIIDIGFEKVFLLMNPATYEIADIFSTFVYRTGLTLGNYSYGTAVDLFTGVVSLIFIYTANYASRKVSDTSLW